jgi:hypothetical protein
VWILGGVKSQCQVRNTISRQQATILATANAQYISAYHCPLSLSLRPIAFVRILGVIHLSPICVHRRPLETDASSVGASLYSWQHPTLLHRNILLFFLYPVAASKTPDTMSNSDFLGVRTSTFRYCHRKYLIISPESDQHRQEGHRTRQCR